MAKATPKAKSITVAYSFGFTRQIVQFEPVKVNIARSEEWDVTGMTEADISAFREERHKVVAEEVMTEINEEYNKL